MAEAGEARNKVLLVGWDRDDIARYKGALNRSGLDLEYSDPSAAMKNFTRKAFSLIIANYPLDGTHFEDVVSRLRSPACPSCGAGFIVLATPETMEEVSKMVGRGVNKVLSRHDDPDVLSLVVSRLREGASSGAKRKNTSLPVDVFVSGSWRNWRTQNVSHSGMLILTDEPLPPGVRLRFRLRPEGGVDPINGEAIVVRVTYKHREDANGIGVRFCSFDGKGRQRMGAFVDSLGV